MRGHRPDLPVRRMPALAKTSEQRSSANPFEATERMAAKQTLRRWELVGLRSFPSRNSKKLARLRRDAEGPMFLRCYFWARETAVAQRWRQVAHAAHRLGPVTISLLTV
jgi:hypothetical protein